jgi:hypothetical protein
MRKIVLLAAMLVAPGFAALPAEAGDRGPGFRHFSPHLGAPHAWRHGNWSNPVHFRHVGPRHFGHSRHFPPRHHSGAFLKFHGGDFGFRLGSVPHFKPRHFVPHARPHHFVERHHFGFAKPHHFRRHHHRPPALTFARPSHFKPWGFSQHHHKSWRGRSHRRW